jgi:hypothetical protein
MAGAVKVKAHTRRKPKKRKAKKASSAKKPGQLGLF